MCKVCGYVVRYACVWYACVVYFVLYIAYHGVLKWYVQLMNACGYRFVWLYACMCNVIV